jgi:hypothetical protein
VEEKRCPHRVALICVDQDSLRDGLQSRQEGLQDSSAGERIRASLSHERRQNLVLGRCAAAQPTQVAKQLLRGREPDQRRLPRGPLPELGVNWSGCEHGPFGLEPLDQVTPAV